ncbi:ABC transporter permease [Actinomadura spongiicola]|uniref:Transport permease protein n=1 Tax=Actinomadura spongiicola TaxID=2303421 RepID=A0A372GDT7_9ACTN|nr:ABC transporter permease [Actinomadura spongiicola]RFS83534.1 ABC transporter permease [Actinomadura spongiicola]
MRALRRLTLTELKLFLRAPESVFFVPGLPLLLVTVFGVILDPGDAPDRLRGPLMDYFPAMVLSLTLAILSILIMPSTLVGYREKGILRRMATTPVGPDLVLVAQTLVSAMMAVATLVLVTVLGTVAFGWSTPGDVAGVAVAFLLAVSALLAVGLFIASISTSGGMATGIGLFVFFPSLFLSGVAMPAEAMPPNLASAGEFTPLGAAMRGLRDSWTGSFPETSHLLTLAVLTCVFGAAAVKLFRWE